MQAYIFRKLKPAIHTGIMTDGSKRVLHIFKFVNAYVPIGRNILPVGKVLFEGDGFIATLNLKIKTVNKMKINEK